MCWAVACWAMVVDGFSIQSRIRTLREKVFGKGGASMFAEALAVVPDEYRRFEENECPSLAILVRMARIAGVDLRWLLTGQFGPDDFGVSADDREEIGPIVARLAERLDTNDASIQALAAFVDLLEDHVDVRCRMQERSQSGMPRSRILIPVVGRTAADVPQFWASGDNRVDVWFPPCAPELSAINGFVAGNGGDSVRIVRHATPTQIGDVPVDEWIEFPIDESGSRCLCALRVDGESMSPIIDDGDWVAIDVEAAPLPGKPAIIKLADQIGVTCKLWRADGKQVHLIPANESFPITKHDRGEVEYACRVLTVIKASSA